MSIFSGKDGEFILKHAVDSIKLELLEGKISKRKAYAIVYGAPSNENAQKVGLVKAGSMSAEELKIFVKILDKKFTKLKSDQID